MLNLCHSPAAELIAADILAGKQDCRDIVQTFTRHADEREAQVIAAVVAWQRKFAGNMIATQEAALMVAADAIERGDWKGPRHAE